MESMIQIYVEESVKALEFYKKAFDAKLLGDVHWQFTEKEGVVVHAELDVFGQILAISDVDFGIRETIVFDMFRIGIDLPIYCMYGVLQNQIKESDIIIDKRVINDYCPNGGYLTICDTMQFINQFKDICEGKYNYNIGMVMYGNKSLKLDMKLLESMTSAHHYKDSFFSYQQEFRIVLDKKLARLKIPHNETPHIPVKYKRKGLYCYKFDTFSLEIGDISSFSKQFLTDSLKEHCENYFWLKL